LFGHTFNIESFSLYFVSIFSFLPLAIDGEPLEIELLCSRPMLVLNSTFSYAPAGASLLDFALTVNGSLRPTLPIHVWFLLASTHVLYAADRTISETNHANLSEFSGCYNTLCIQRLLDMLLHRFEIRIWINSRPQTNDETPQCVHSCLGFEVGFAHVPHRIPCSDDWI
jgi:hypothetical protein